MLLQSEGSRDEDSGVSEDDDSHHGNAADEAAGTSGIGDAKGGHPFANLGDRDPPSPDARAAALRPTSARPPTHTAGKSFMEQLVEAMEGVNKHLDSSSAARHNQLTLVGASSAFVSPGGSSSRSSIRIVTRVALHFPLRDC